MEAEKEKLNNNVYLAARYNRLEFYKKESGEKTHDRGKNSAEIRQLLSTPKLQSRHRMGMWTHTGPERSHDPKLDKQYISLSDIGGQCHTCRKFHRQNKIVEVS